MRRPSLSTIVYYRKRYEAKKEQAKALLDTLLKVYTINMIHGLRVPDAGDDPEDLAELVQKNVCPNMDEDNAACERHYDEESY